MILTVICGFIGYWILGGIINFAISIWDDLNTKSHWQSMVNYHAEQDGWYSRARAAHFQRKIDRWNLEIEQRTQALMNTPQPSQPQ